MAASAACLNASVHLFALLFQKQIVRLRRECLLCIRSLQSINELPGRCMDNRYGELAYNYLSGIKFVCLCLDLQCALHFNCVKLSSLQRWVLSAHVIVNLSH